MSPLKFETAGRFSGFRFKDFLEMILYESKLYELKLYEMQLYESKLYEMLLSLFNLIYLYICTMISYFDTLLFLIKQLMSFYKSRN